MKPPVRRLFRCGFTRAKPWESPGAKWVEIWKQEGECQPAYWGWHLGEGGAWEGMREGNGTAEIRAETETMDRWGGQMGKGGDWAQC